MSSQPQLAADTARAMLRHTLATLAYRGGKALHGAPENFASFRSAPDSRTPLEILSHIGDLLDWALSHARGKEEWHNATPHSWVVEIQRFHAGMERLDQYLASDSPLGSSPEKIFQGPLADALTHVGQIAMLRRLGGCPIRGENYLRAEIVAGRVGPAQAKPVREFD